MLHITHFMRHNVLPSLCYFSCQAYLFMLHLVTLASATHQTASQGYCGLTLKSACFEYMCNIQLLFCITEHGSEMFYMLTREMYGSHGPRGYWLLPYCQPSCAAALCLATLPCMGIYQSCILKASFLTFAMPANMECNAADVQQGSGHPALPKCGCRED